MNRYEFAGITESTTYTIFAPDQVKFRIIETKLFHTKYEDGVYGYHKDFKILRHRIEIVAGNLHYPYGIYLKNKNTHFDCNDQQVWIGKKWVDKKLRERARRRGINE